MKKLWVEDGVRNTIGRRVYDPQQVGIAGAEEEKADKKAKMRTITRVSVSSLKKCAEGEADEGVAMDVAATGSLRTVWEHVTYHMTEGLVPVSEGVEATSVRGRLSNKTDQFDARDKAGQRPGTSQVAAKRTRACSSHGQVMIE
ncbi:hypothetical protein Dimus_032904 [Dionaea muscipula]